jgi:hypothetical protein
LCRLHVDPAEFFTYTVKHHNDLISLITTTSAEGYFDPALTTMIASELLRVGEGHLVRLNVGLLEFSDTNILVAVVSNDLDLVLVVTHGEINRWSLLE